MHLPVQSGSNNVLKAMRRGHTIENYLEKIDKIKSASKKLALTTDIIIGFPNESDKDFQDTLKMADYCKFDSAYIFKYSPRQGTPAFAMTDNVSEAVKTERFLELEKLIRLNQRGIFESYLDKTVEVLAEKVSNKNDSELSGHTTCQKVVNFKGSAEILGKIVKVKITETKTNTLYGEIYI